MTFNQKEKLIKKIENKFFQLIKDECEWHSNEWYCLAYAKDVIIGMLKKEIET